MKLRTIPDAARSLGIPQSRIRSAIRSGEIKAVELGNRLLVDVDSIHGWAAAQRHDGLMDYLQVSDATGLTVSAIRRGVREGWIPMRSIGKGHWFDYSEVVKAITERMR